MNKKYIAIPLSLSLLAVAFWVFSLRNTIDESKNTVPMQSESERKNHYYSQEKPLTYEKEALDKIQTETNGLNFPAYKFTKEEVYTWVQNYPKTKEKLIEVATSEDPYAAEKIEVKPHSSHEIQQEKYGALRVMALQALFDHEDTPELKLKNLEEILKKAKDPVIKKISESMINSHKKGRDYVEDFLEAAGK